MPTISNFRVTVIMSLTQLFMVFFSVTGHCGKAPVIYKTCKTLNIGKKETQTETSNATVICQRRARVGVCWC